MCSSCVRFVYFFFFFAQSNGTCRHWWNIYLSFFSFYTNAKHLICSSKQLCLQLEPNSTANWGLIIGQFGASPDPRLLVRAQVLRPIQVHKSGWTLPVPQIQLPEELQGRQLAATTYQVSSIHDVDIHYNRDFLLDLWSVVCLMILWWYVILIPVYLCPSLSLSLYIFMRWLRIPQIWMWWTEKISLSDVRQSIFTKLPPKATPWERCLCQILLMR